MHGPTDRHKRRENPRQPVVVIAAKEQRGERTIGGVGQNGRDRGVGNARETRLTETSLKSRSLMYVIRDAIYSAIPA